jgi:Tol biopolymer transport system component
MSSGKTQFLSGDISEDAYMGGPAWSGSWSPDRSKIAFVLDLSFYLGGRPYYRPQGTDLSKFAHRSGVWVAHRDGTGLAQVVDLLEPKNVFVNQELNQDVSGPASFWGPRQAMPSWSPDGEKIAVMFPQTAEKLQVLYVVDR